LRAPSFSQFGGSALPHSEKTAWKLWWDHFFRCPIVASWVSHYFSIACVTETVAHQVFLKRERWRNWFCPPTQKNNRLYVCLFYSRLQNSLVLHIIAQMDGKSRNEFIKTDKFVIIFLTLTQYYLIIM
jgi:hypothetical protein